MDASHFSLLIEDEECCETSVVGFTSCHSNELTEIMFALWPGGHCKTEYLLLSASTQVVARGAGDAAHRTDIGWISVQG